MGKEKIKYAAFLNEDGYAFKTFWQPGRGVVINGRPTFQCTDADLVGIHMRLRVVLQDTKAVHTLWVQAHEVLALLEIEREGKVGF